MKEAKLHNEKLFNIILPKNQNNPKMLQKRKEFLWMEHSQQVEKYS